MTDTIATIPAARANATQVASPTTLATFTGLVAHRIRTEMTHKLHSIGMLGSLFIPVLIFVVYRHQAGVLGGAANQRGLALSYLAVSVAMAGMMTLSGAIMADQEDGSLLRLRLMPTGIGSYLTAKIIMLTLSSVASSIGVAVAAHLAIGGVLPRSITIWLLLVPFALFCMACTAPIGILIGCLTSNVLTSLPVMLFGFGLVFISGVLFPLEALPHAVGVLAKVFPLYWLGDLARHLFAGTLGQVTWHGLVVPLLWMGVGLGLSPTFVRRLTRRQSGHRLARNAEKRVYGGR